MTLADILLYLPYIAPETIVLSKSNVNGRRKQSNDYCLFDVSISPQEETCVAQVELSSDIADVRRKVEAANTNFFLKLWMCTQAKYLEVDEEDYLYLMEEAEREAKNVVQIVSEADAKKYSKYCTAMWSTFNESGCIANL